MTPDLAACTPADISGLWFFAFTMGGVLIGICLRELLPLAADLFEPPFSQSEDSWK